MLSMPLDCKAKSALLLNLDLALTIMSQIRKAGGKDNGAPGIRVEMSRQPYYAAFVIDAEGNNIEAVCVDKNGVK